MGRMATSGLLARMKFSARWSRLGVEIQIGAVQRQPAGDHPVQMRQRALERRPGRIIRAAPIDIEADRQRPAGLRLQDGGQHPVGQCALRPVQAGNVLQPALAGRLRQPLGAGEQAGLLGALHQLGGLVASARPGKSTIDPRRQARLATKPTRMSKADRRGPGHNLDRPRAVPSRRRRSACWPLHLTQCGPDTGKCVTQCPADCPDPLRSGASWRRHRRGAAWHYRAFMLTVAQSHSGGNATWRPIIVRNVRAIAVPIP